MKILQFPILRYEKLKLKTNDIANRVIQCRITFSDRSVKYFARLYELDW